MSFKIMVVDAEPRTSLLMRSQAIPLGYVVAPFDDYEPAAAKGEVQNFDAIFVGLQPERPKGFEFIRRIRTAEPNRSSVVIVMSMTEDIGLLRKAFGEGADLFLVKPVPADRLHRMLAGIPEWKSKRHAVRLPLFTAVRCECDGHICSLRSLNVSETGILLQGAHKCEIGRLVNLEFTIAELHTSLKLTARAVRMEGADRVGLGFVSPLPEHVNAIQLYVSGRLKDLTRPAREYLSETRPRRLYN